MVNSNGNDASIGPGFWWIWSISIIGDTRGEAPILYWTSTGLVGWNPTPVHIKFNSNEEIKQIHYVLDKEEFIFTDERLLTLTKNGIHYIICWAIDMFGNEELPHILIPIKIDMNEPPNFRIEAPEKGLYLFERKMSFQVNKTFIVGEFEIIVNASDETSGVDKVKIFYNNEILYLDEKEPFVFYFDIQYLGKMELKVIVEDVAGNSAQETMEVYYYNFF